MSAIPLIVPVRLQEAAALAELIWQIVKPAAGAARRNASAVSPAHRSQLAARLASLQLQSITVFPWSLLADPIAHSAFYVAVDVPADPAAPNADISQKRSFLLHLALSSSTAAGHFPHALLVGRITTSSALELVINAIPFEADGNPRLAVIPEEMDRSLLPRPQGAGGLLVAATANFDEAFAAFRRLQSKHGLNVAAIELAGSGPAAEASRLEMLRAATRHGWRDGYLCAGQPGAVAGLTRSNLQLTSLEELLGQLKLLHAPQGDSTTRLHDWNLRLQPAPPGTRPLTTPEQLRAILQPLRQAGFTPMAIEVELGRHPDRPYPTTFQALDPYLQGTTWQEIQARAEWLPSQSPLLELRDRTKQLAETARTFGTTLLIPGHPSDLLLSDSSPSPSPFLETPFLETLAQATPNRLYYQLSPLHSPHLDTLSLSLR